MDDVNETLHNPLMGANDHTPAMVLPDVSRREPLGSGIVIGLLGFGGMANVYEIWDAHMELHRAVKIIKPDCSKDARERFDTEIKIMAKLGHPNIVDIHSVGVWKGLPYIEMEKVEGKTLRHLLDTRGLFSAVECTAVGILLCRGLVYAHQREYVIYGKTYQGIIHRDLKPGNAMITPSGVLKIMDFGVARPVDASFHTMDGAVVGTMAYMPPEMLCGGIVDFRADIYSLGATLYEMVTGVNPFAETNITRLVMLKRNNLYRPLNGYRIQIPDRLKNLIHRCMHLDPHKRYEKTRKVLDELEYIHRKMTSEAPETILRRLMADSDTKRHAAPTRTVVSWTKIGAAVLLCAVLVAVVFVSLPPIQSLVQQYEVKRRTSSGVSVAPLPAALPAPVPMTPIAVDTFRDNGVPPQERAAVKTVRRDGGKTASHKVVAQPDEQSVARTPPRDTATRPNVPPSVPVAVTALDAAIQQRGTADVFELVDAELVQGSPVVAEELWAYLTPQQQATTRAVLQKIRLLQKQGKKGQLAKYITGVSVNDGEFLLAKAVTLYENGDHAGAASVLNDCAGAPVQFSDYQRIKRDVHYYKALCATKAFDVKPSRDTYLGALEEWRNVGALFSNDRANPLYRTYRQEVQRIGEKYKTIGE